MEDEGILSYHHSSQAGRHWGGSQLAEGNGMGKGSPIVEQRFRK